MPRVKAGTTRRQRHKAILKAAKGHRAARSRRYRVAKESMLHALNYATRHRKLKKRQNRALAITRINAAVREHGLSYSAFIHALGKANIGPRKIGLLCDQQQSGAVGRMGMREQEILDIVHEGLIRGKNAEGDGFLRQSPHFARIKFPQRGRDLAQEHLHRRKRIIKGLKLAGPCAGPSSRSPDCGRLA